METFKVTCRKSAAIKRRFIGLVLWVLLLLLGIVVVVLVPHNARVKGSTELVDCGVIITHQRAVLSFEQEFHNITTGCVRSHRSPVNVLRGKGGKAAHALGMGQTRARKFDIASLLLIPVLGCRRHATMMHIGILSLFRRVHQKPRGLRRRPVANSIHRPTKTKQPFYKIRADSMTLRKRHKEKKTCSSRRCRSLQNCHGAAAGRRILCQA
mmetsp:Transcript_16631/g.38200  ORF Transcript_16631/g.38200 Transcript_16631/m.38200 type:complete len:211 (+) Transcript_16631:2259-2891(+)